MPVTAGGHPTTAPAAVLPLQVMVIVLPYFPMAPIQWAAALQQQQQQQHLSSLSHGLLPIVGLWNLPPLLPQLHQCTNVGGFLMMPILMVPQTPPRVSNQQLMATTPLGQLAGVQSPLPV